MSHLFPPCSERNTMVNSLVWKSICFFLQTTFLEDGISFAFLKLWNICNIYVRYFCIQVRELLLLFKRKKIFLNQEEPCFFCFALITSEFEHFSMNVFV